MIRKLQYFLTIDDAARYRAALTGAPFGFVSGMLLQRSGGSFRVSAYVSVGIAAGIFALRTWVYCRAAKPRSVAQSASERRRILRPATAIAAVFLLSVPTIPRTEARAVDGRLRALTRSSQLTPNASGRIADALGLAQQWDLSIPSATLVKVRGAIESSARKAPSVGDLPEAADALAAYGRSRDRGFLLNGGEAVAELNAGAELLGRAVKGSPSDLASHRDELNAAVAVLTRAIELSDGDRDLRSHALIARCIAYSLLFRFGEAYADAKSAKDLGSTDLYLIFWMEGVNLANHATNADDLREAAGLLTLVTRMQPSKDLDATRYLASATLGEVYYGLGQFRQARDAALEALASAPPLMMGTLYELLTLCYLRSGEYEQAMAVAEEYETKVGDVYSVQWLRVVQDYRSAPESSLNLLERIRHPLHLREAAP